MGELKNEVGEIKSRVGEMEKVDHDWITSGALLSGWKFIGRGYQGSADDDIVEHNLSFAQCVETCEEKRAKTGGNLNRDWNGLWWFPKNGFCQCNKNDRGHTHYEGYMHFRRSD